MKHLLSNNDISIEYDPKTISLVVSVRGSDITWSWVKDAAKVRLSNGTSFALKDAVCESRPSLMGRW